MIAPDDRIRWALPGPPFVAGRNRKSYNHTHQHFSSIECFRCTIQLSDISLQNHTLTNMNSVAVKREQRLLLLLHRMTAVHVRSSVRLMPQNQSSGRGLLPNPTAWSPHQHHAAILADVSRRILGRGLGLGQFVRTHTEKCLKCQSSSDGYSDHSAPCAGGR